MIGMIDRCDSMDDFDKSYWKWMMDHSMEEKHVIRLWVILSLEKNQLQELEESYDKEIAALNIRHLQEWKEIFSKNNTRSGRFLGCNQ